VEKRGRGHHGVGGTGLRGSHAGCICGESGSGMVSEERR